MRKITDRDCWVAAKKALAAHLALRPCTPQEAAEKAAKYRRMEENFQKGATEIRSFAHCDKHEANFFESFACKAASHAEAWEVIATEPEGQTYANVEQELRERVAFYEALVTSKV